MFGSQALETTIGLAALFFLLATLASSITEVISRLMKKRARDLENTIQRLLVGAKTRDEAETALTKFKETSIWQASASAAKNKASARRKTAEAGKLRPTYMSARAFADAVFEMVAMSETSDAPATGSGATGSGATGSGATGSGATGSGATGSGAAGSSAPDPAPMRLERQLG